MAISNDAAILSLIKQGRKRIDQKQEIVERRKGDDRRKHDDPHYNGPSRRQTLDRRK